jgi:hypothetical protein
MVQLFIANIDFTKKKPIIINVTIGESSSGTGILKARKIIIMPSTRIEYMAPFLR